MQQERFTVEIPVSRRAFSDCYGAPRNKKLIYWLSLASWIILFMFMMTILPLTATSSYRVAFYLPLVCFIILLAASTHWLLDSALQNHHVNSSSHNEYDNVQTIYKVDESVVQ